MFASKGATGNRHGTGRVVFSPDRQLVASRSGDDMVRLWNIKTKGAVCATGCVPHDKPSFNSNGLLLMIGAKEIDSRFFTSNTVSP